MLRRWRQWKFGDRLEASCGGLSEHAVAMCAKRYRVNTRKPQNRRYPSRDMDPQPPENEEGVITTPPSQESYEFVTITTDFTTLMSRSVTIPQFLVVRMPWTLACSETRAGRQRCPPHTGVVVGENGRWCAEQRSRSDGWTRRQRVRNE
jgi:hypothetical protein